jgi:hypothetical protein
MTERPLKYRVLISKLKRFDVVESTRRGKGSERMLTRLVAGRVEHYFRFIAPLCGLFLFASLFPEADYARTTGQSARLGRLVAAWQSPFCWPGPPGSHDQCKKGVVDRAGIEPATPGFSVQCSTN